MSGSFSPADAGSGVLGRRSAPRLRLRAPAKLVSVSDTRNCLLLDVSRTGALLCLRRPLAIDACGYLRVGPVEAFSVTVRVNERWDEEPVSAVQFDMPLMREQVMEMRIYAQEHARMEHQSRLSAARDWAHGIGR